MSISKKHHYIPQFYQKLFLQKGKTTVWFTPLTDLKKAEERNPRSILYEKHRHNLPTPGQRDDELEHALSTLESDTATKIKDFCKKDAWSLDEKGWMAEFLSTLYVRTPAYEKRVADIIRASNTGYLRSIANNETLLADCWRWLTDEQIANGEEARYASSEELKNELLTVGESLFIEANPKFAFAMAMKGYTEMIPVLMEEFQWNLVEASRGRFVTSDHPVVIFERTADSIGFGPGITLERTEIILALSPQFCLHLTKSPHTKPYPRRANIEVVEEINELIITNAHQSVVSTYKLNKKQESWISERQHLSPQSEEELGAAIGAFTKIQENSPTLVGALFQL